jgi:hypothetical protein
MPLNPMSQDFFGSEASQLPGTRRGFGTTATENVSPIIPAPTPPSSTGGGSLAPPPVPSAPSLFAPTAGSRLETPSPVGPNQGIRLPTTPPPPVPGPGRVVVPGPGGSPPAATPGAGSSVPGPIAGQDPSQYVLALINAGLSPQDAVAHANSLLGDVALYYNDNRGQTIGLHNNYLALGADGRWTIVPRMPETSSALAPPIVPTTGGPTGPLDLSSIDVFTDPSTQFLQDFVKQYMAQLLGPVYSDQATAALKAGPMNAIEASRQSELRQARESLGSMGVSPSSGVVAEVERQINAKYDAYRAGSDNAFATSGIARSDANKQQALSLAGLLADLPVQRLQVAEQAAGTGANPASIFSSSSTSPGSRRRRI